MALSSWSSSEDFSRDPNRSPDALNWFGLALEVFCGIFVIVISIYLRVADLHPTAVDLNWAQICEDLNLRYNKLSSDNELLLYVIVILASLVFIVILELGYTLFSRSSCFARMNKSERLCKSLPRITRIIGMFILGAFMASFFADYFNIVITQPRPYFWTQYGSNCPSAFNGTHDSDFYDALKSFPCHLACEAGFCCMFAINYAHSFQETRRASTMVTIMTQGLIVLALTVSLDPYTNHINHLSDIVGGLIIGILLAVYMCSLLPLNGKSLVTREKSDNWSNFWNFFIPRARVNLPPTTAEARNVMNT